MLIDRRQSMKKASLIWILFLLWSVPVHASPATLLTNNDDVYAKSVYQDILHAKRSIVIACYEWRLGRYSGEWPNRILAALIQAHKRGVKVLVVLNSKQEGQKPKSQGWKGIEEMLQEHKKEMESTPPNKQDIYQANAAVLSQLNEAHIEATFAKHDELAHLKVIVIDDRIVYIGSHNLTESALHYNYETSVRIVDHKLAMELIDYINTIIPDFFKATV